MIRRSFLAAGASGVALAGAGTAVFAEPVAPTVTAWHFDRGAFEAVLNRPVRHRQVFATTQLSDGQVLHYMENALDAYEHGFGEGPGTLHVAAVTYGTALVLALDDAAWATYRLGDLVNGVPSQHEGDPALIGAQKNPFGTRVDALVARGASFFVCNNALMGASGTIAKYVPSRTAAAVHDDLTQHLRPGAMVVPAGVAALNAAQEARFTLVQATIG